MRLIAAGCLLVVLVAAAQAADSAPQLFVDFLSAASSSSTPAAAAGEAQARIASAAAEPAAYYEEVETHVACLREVGFKNCRSILGSCDACSDLSIGMAFFESSVSCCKDGSEGYGYQQRDGMLGPDDIEIGSCEWEYVEFDAPIPVTGSADKIGKYKAICSLKSAAHLCGYPFCDQMVLVSEGSIYDSKNVVSPVDPEVVLPLEDASCTAADAAEVRNGRKKDATAKAPGTRTSRRHKSNPFKLAAARAPVAASTKGGVVKTAAASDKDATAAKAAKYGGYHSDGYGGGSDGGHNWYLGDAYIFSGPMSIQSRRYDVKIQSGWLEYVYDLYNPLPIPEAQALEKYRVVPYTYTLKFTKPGQDKSK